MAVALAAEDADGLPAGRSLDDAHDVASGRKHRLGVLYGEGLMLTVDAKLAHGVEVVHGLAGDGYFHFFSMFNF